MKDPYDILGIEPGATLDEVKRAYRALAKELHPDANPDDTVAANRFREATEAYDLLSDPDRRVDYDSGGWRRGYADGFGPEGEAFDFDDGIGERPIDLFGDIAGNRRGRVFGAASTSLALPGEDLAETVGITVKEAEEGTRKVVELVTGARVEVIVAPGTESGRTLTFEGLGLPGIGGAPPGDLNVIVEILPAPMLDGDRSG
ncbi:MAG: DnaJ domain-containing protein [Defluviicoccus sp.]|nr:DnaJ domain-containing protein [Defluviicoccus sp.]MDE0276614.1 DnaJ domain-containing protein [Defluviicoccus sp.]